jgi:Ca2+-binding EF-hand superfamily protein
MVDKAFRSLDKDGSALINVRDIINVYDVSKDKDFIAGKKSKEQILNEFLNSFDGLKGNNDGTITYQEWVDYYTDLAMSTPSDEYFVQMMESVWCTSEDEENGIFKDKVKALVSMMRQRLLMISNSSQEEFVLRKIFKDFDSNGSGTITIDELGAMLAKLQISVERKYISAMIKVLDKNNSGMLEFEEFANFLLYDPYK